MEIGKSIGVIVIGYFVIGGLITLTRLGLTKVFEPPCNGTPIHTLWAGFRQDGIVDLSDRLVATRQGKPADEPLLVYAVRVGLRLAQWLPDLYREVIVGDMTVRDYLLGGYQCIARPKNVGSVLRLFIFPLHEPVQRQRGITYQPFRGACRELAAAQLYLHNGQPERNNPRGILHPYLDPKTNGHADHDG